MGVTFELEWGELFILIKLITPTAMLVTETSMPALSSAMFSISNLAGKSSLSNLRLLKLVHHFGSDWNCPTLNLDGCSFASKTVSFVHSLNHGQA
jgi:hypothetical protein